MNYRTAKIPSADTTAQAHERDATCYYLPSRMSAKQHGDGYIGPFWFTEAQTADNRDH